MDILVYKDRIGALRYLVAFLYNIFCTMDTHFFFALMLTVGAGISTGIGSFFVFFSRKLSSRFLAGSLGFSAWVMIYVSFMEILPKAKEQVGTILSEKEATIWVTWLFFLGIGVVALIDRLVPSYENPHEIKNIRALEDDSSMNEKKLLRMGIFSALAIALHNFPEGLATFVAALQEPEVGISIALAIAIHNIPEGIAIAIPVYYATKSKMRSALLGLASGLAEVAGAILWYFLLLHWFPGLNFGYVFAVIAGVMVYISLDELLPTAEEYGEHHTAITGLVIGMAVMALSLILLG